MTKSKEDGYSVTGFGFALRAVREKAGLSQAALAGRAECSIRTLSRLEAGAADPSWPLALALARALGVSVAAFEVAPAATPPKRRGRPRTKAP